MMMLLKDPHADELVANLEQVGSLYFHSPTEPLDLVTGK
jgi:hypothetical protein